MLLKTGAEGAAVRLGDVGEAMRPLRIFLVLAFFVMIRRLFAPWM
ncbi:hypothetical protein QCN27_08560 [Cereibacter sp. SYSU M97828]|nr:hypothetical protein [Cereibacter flavus]